MINNKCEENKEWLNKKYKEYFERAVNEALDIKQETDMPISAYGSVSVAELNELYNNFHKIPTYDELMKGNIRISRALIKYAKRLDYLCKHTTQQNDYYSALMELGRILEEEKVGVLNGEDYSQDRI